MMDKRELDRIIENALTEDMPFGDITTDNLIPEHSMSEAIIIAKEEGIIAGLEVAERVFRIMESSVVFIAKVKDGDTVKKGDIIARINGQSRAMLKAERTALNFLQRLSGIATKTRELTEKVRDFKVRITDTRKTTPGLRMLEKYAVAAGGGYNHRYCLSDAVMIKDNHIKACGGIKNAVEKARVNAPHTATVEVETTNLSEVQEALDCKADIIMLDNMEASMMKQAVSVIAGRALTEASGNVTADNIREKAAAGVDIISVGGITHSVKSLDLSMKFL